jgi:hypothetical protein
MPNPVRDYVHAMRQTLKAGMATERSHYPALSRLLEAAAPPVVVGVACRLPPDED